MIIGSGKVLTVAAGATRVDHVDIDSAAVRLCAEHLPYGYSVDELDAAEGGSGPIVVHYCDGWSFVENVRDPYNVVCIDLPDERAENAQHNRLYGSDFLQRCRAVGGVVTAQAGSARRCGATTPDPTWQRFNDAFDTVVYFNSDEHEWAFLSGTHAGVVDDPSARLIARLAGLPYRPTAIDADSIAAATVAPITLRCRAIRE